jgi:hypothetical protein
MSRYSMLLCSRFKSKNTKSTKLLQKVKKVKEMISDKAINLNSIFVKTNYNAEYVFRYY